MNPTELSDTEIQKLFTLERINLIRESFEFIQGLIPKLEVPESLTEDFKLVLNQSDEELVDMLKEPKGCERVRVVFTILSKLQQC